LFTRQYFVSHSVSAPSIISDTYTAHRTLIMEATCKENACLFRETKHAFKKLDPEHDVICYVSSFGLALRKSGWFLLVVVVFISLGILSSTSACPFMHWLRGPDAAHRAV